MKCLKKSYSLSPHDDAVCEAYVCALVTQQQNKEAMQILDAITRRSPSRYR